ncbi:MAG: hypothetical protein JXB15_08145 [Anaerolineales bacterium]|nr:hypothetical protein [Anaerolineales bacterium]
MTRINPRDWEQLSAYLDDQITPQERSRLESRIRAEEPLRSALGELRRTRAILRRQPRLRAPRNFTLTPQMASLRPGVRSQPSAYPVLRLASVLSAIFFLIVFVGDLAATRLQPSVVAQAPQLIAPPGMGGGGLNGAVTPELDALSIETQAVEAPMAKEVARPQPTETEVVEEQPVELALPLTATETAVEAQPLPDERAMATPEREEGLGGGEAEDILPTQPVGEQEPAALLVRSPLLKILQVLLALLAIGAGLAAYLLRRSSTR